MCPLQIVSCKKWGKVRVGRQVRHFNITVLTGLNAGVELPMTPGRHSIGGAEDDDIQLDGVSGTLADFVLERDAIKIKPRVADISAKTDGTLEVGKVTTHKLPLRISLTPQIDIFADFEPEPAPKRRILKPMMALAGVLVAALALTALQVDFKFNATQATASSPLMQAADRPSPRVPMQVAQVTEPSAPACTDCAVDAASALRQSLAEAGILGVVVTSSGGAVRVDGGLTAADRAKWGGIRSGFDAKWSMVPLLTSFTETKNGAPLSVASVWLGEPREIKTAAGETMMIGDVISDGWTLSAIEPDYVELIQGETKLRVTY